jgi:membrane associated rhomboid family serine protease
MISILNIIIVTTVLISLKGLNDHFFFRKYDFHIASIQQGQSIRMISSGFLHGDLAHLFFNMYSLYMFANVVIENFGDITFTILYFGSLLIGNLLTLYFHENDYQYRAIGASGAVMGIIYSAILIEPNMGIGIMFIPFSIPAYIFGIIYLLYSIYGMRAQNDSIGHTAHFGGAVGGYLITLISKPDLLFYDTKNVLLLAIPMIALYVLGKLGKI